MNLVTIISESPISQQAFSNYASYFGFGIFIFIMLITVCFILNANAAAHFIRLFVQIALVCAIIIAICLTVKIIDKDMLTIILSVLGITAVGSCAFVIICLLVGSEKTDEEQRIEDEAQIKAIRKSHERRQAQKAARNARKNAHKHHANES